MSACAGLLAGFHAMIAIRRNEQHWLLSDSEAKRYGKALSDALRWIPVAVSQKALDFAALVGAAVEMDGERIRMSRQLAAAALARGPIPPGGAQIFTFTPPPGAPGPQPGQTPPPAAPPPEPFVIEPDLSDVGP